MAVGVDAGAGVGGRCRRSGDVGVLVWMGRQGFEKVRNVEALGGGVGAGMGLGELV